MPGKVCWRTDGRIFNKYPQEVGEGVASAKAWIAPWKPENPVHKMRHMEVDLGEKFRIKGVLGVTPDQSRVRRSVRVG